MTGPPTRDDSPGAKREAGEAFAEPWFDEDAGDVAPLRRPAHGTPPPSDEQPPTAPLRRGGLARPQTPPPGRRPRRGRAAARRDTGVGRRLVRMLAIVLGAGLLVLAVRGLADIAGGDSSSGSGVQSGGVAGAAGWPDDEARAFSVQFARAFLTFSPSRPRYHELAVKPFLAKRLRGAVALPDRGPDQTVSTITVARARATGPDRALVTVAATVLNRTVTTRYLTVPVARDRNGGLVVYDYPAFSAPPPTADVASDEQRPLEGAAAGPIRRFVRRFFKAYLEGGDLAAFTTAGARLSPLQQPYGLRKVLDVSQVGDGAADERTVAVVVRARDRATRADYTLRYRARLVLRSDRWYVQTLDGTVGQVDR